MFSVVHLVIVLLYGAILWRAVCIAFNVYVRQCGVSKQRKLTQHASVCCGAVDGSQGTQETLKGLIHALTNFNVRMQGKKCCQIKSKY